MSKVQVNPFQLHGWQGHRINCGAVSLVFVPAIGGRIVSLRFEGKELLFMHKEIAGQVFDFSTVEDLNAHKREIGFRLWGGDKTWIAPQREWQEGVPPLELDAGNYALTWEGMQAVMTSPVCRETGLQIVRRIHVDEEQTVHLSEEIKNMTADRVIRKGIWNVTQILRPCVFYVQARKQAFRSYHHDDSTLPEVKDIFIENDGWVEIPCRNNTLFKCGGIPTDGQVLIKMPLGGPKEVVWLKTFALDAQAEYAHRSAVEVYNSDQHNYAELEIHAPLVTLEPSASVSLQQQWRFRKL